jgi:hypothetical protein
VPRTVDYLYDVSYGLARIRAHYTLSGGEVVELLVQLEVWHVGQWTPARRYDDAHGKPHMDVLDLAGHVYSKTWLEYSRNETVTIALKDFGENWEQYAAEFLGR